MFRVALAILAAAPLCALAQQDSDDVRISVVLNTDGSGTVYENDAANHKTVATTTFKDGQLREKIRWDLDEHARFLHGEVFAPKEQFRFILPDRLAANHRRLQAPHV